MFDHHNLHSKSATVAMRLLSVFLIALCASACGQDLQIPTSQVTDFSSDVSADERASQPVYENACQDGFWFLTTHYCAQKFDLACPRFRPLVSRYDSCSSFRQSSLSELTSQLQPGVPVCVVVHGSFVDLPNASKESVCTWKWLRDSGNGQPVQVIYFYWPSFKRISLTVQRDVNLLGRQAARNGFYLADLISQIPPECPTCLIGHSHGTRVIASGLHLMSGGTVQGVAHRHARANGRRIRSVFLASAIDHDWLNPGHKYDRALCSTECLLNLTNERDRALRIYPLRLPLIARRPLGLCGLTKKDRYQLGAISQKVVDYSVANAIGSEHLWPYYFNQPQLAMTMKNYVYFSDQATVLSMTENRATTR